MKTEDKHTESIDNVISESFEPVDKNIINKRLRSFVDNSVLETSDVISEGDNSVNNTTNNKNSESEISNVISNEFKDKNKTSKDSPGETFTTLRKREVKRKQHQSKSKMGFYLQCHTY